METAQSTDVRIRKLTEADLAAVASLERRCFEHPWTLGDFRKVWADPLVEGSAAVSDELLVAYVFWDVLNPHSQQRRRLRILNLAVAAPWRRRGIGSDLLAAAISDDLAQAAWALRGRRVETITRERNLPAQLFFRAKGFRCVRILRGYYRSGEDAYQMEMMNKIPANGKEPTR